MIAGVAFLLLLLLPETYAPAILKRRAKRLRGQQQNVDIYAPIELEEKGP